MGLWREVTPAQQRLCLKIPGQDLTVSINRWTPWAWRRGRGSGRKLYLTVITIWHLPELHIRTSPAGCPDPPACVNEAAVNRILLAPTVAIPCPLGGPKKHLSRSRSMPSSKRRQRRCGSWWVGGGGDKVGGSVATCSPCCTSTFQEVSPNFFGANLPDL